MYVSLNTWPFDSEMLVRLNFNPSFQILTSNFYQMIFRINTVILNVNLLIRNLSMSVCNFVLYSSPPRYLHLYTLLSTKQFSFVFRMFSRSTENEGKFKTTFSRHNQSYTTGVFFSRSIGLILGMIPQQSRPSVSCSTNELITNNTRTRYYLAETLPFRLFLQPARNRPISFGTICHPLGSAWCLRFS